IDSETEHWISLMQRYFESSVPPEPQDRDPGKLEKFYRARLTHLLTQITSTITYAHLRCLVVKICFLQLLRELKGSRIGRAEMTELQESAKRLTSQFQDSIGTMYKHFHTYFDSVVSKLSKEELIKYDAKSIDKTFS